ncbi:MAG: hypothetical protein IPI46_13815 [Bacteroidetes bacterium]|nr:hypothetical protein [Bacteroidota bacterium]
MKNQATSIFIQSIKGLFMAAFKVTLLALSWLLSITGMLLSKIAEAIQRIIVKAS